MASEDMKGIDQVEVSPAQIQKKHKLCLLICAVITISGFLYPWYKPKIKYYVTEHRFDFGRVVYTEQLIDVRFGNISTIDDLTSENISIYKIGNVESRFQLAKKRIKTIPIPKLLNYPGLSAHRRKSWKFLKSVKNCSSETENLIIVVPSAPDHFSARKTIRETWGNATNVNLLKSRLVFFIGITTIKQIQMKVETEARYHKDIVLMEVYDGYYRLPVKLVGMLYWVLKYCNTPKYLVKIDDDSLAHLENILAECNRLKHNYERFIAGSIRTRSYVQKRGKWSDPVYLPVYQAGNQYPAYAGGAMYVIANSVVEELYRKCTELPLLCNEDVFITGVCSSLVPNLAKVSMRGVQVYRVSGCVFRTSGITVSNKYSPQMMRWTWDRWHSGNCGCATLNLDVLPT